VSIKHYAVSENNRTPLAEGIEISGGVQDFLRQNIQINLSSFIGISREVGGLGK